MKTFNVVLPIAGHAYLTVEAEDEKSAIAKAHEEVTLQHVEEWTSLDRFNSGNVCHCPSPWDAEATEE